MTSGNKTPTQRLQECQDDLAQYRARLEQFEGVLEELEQLREQVARYRMKEEAGTLVTNAERRRFEERLREAEAGRDSYTRRAIEAERQLRLKAAVVQEIRTLIDGKDCLLPQIKRLIGEAS